MLFTESLSVIGLVTLTIIGTLLPFSTSGGMSSLTLPVCTAAPPVTVRIALTIVSGVAATGRRLTANGKVLAAAALPASLRKRRRVESGCLGACLVGVCLGILN